ncbi:MULTISPECIES: GNAT family N-acetyltransferase [unclassified Sinorhizobium]|uniref:GNAT family N-acetyltransferase n=1 Tax=unclassified Sinorhizobium TaxID=2613772 RepID=UPI0024C3F287|nr:MULTISPECIES: GNAT family N-acetyltransferase [unclassified Sinorhizobium]MDK1376200.1 GNAT family N-acetyltransferase [Sinorhizobium sp. 6-70]MDK1479916.1 GNAT family N-acetyltransferase [Sinorhizobium sp. 6-117]
MDITLEFEPVTARRWPDFEQLFGRQGAFCGCWCVALRLPHAIRTRMSSDERKGFIKDRIATGPPPGILGYYEGAPVAWVQVGPRHDVPQFNSPRTVSRPLDDHEAEDPSVWALSCLFLLPRLRGNGLSHCLLGAAIDHARAGHARFLDACPIDDAKQSKSATLCIGSTAIFDGAGFETVARRKDGRPLMRLDLSR